MEIKLFLLKILFMTCWWYCEARVIAVPRQARLTLAEAPYSYYNRINDGAYSFGYDIADPQTGNNQFRSEERYPNGTVVGSYGYVDPFGRPQRFRYIADEKGYRVVQEKAYQPQKPTYFPPRIPEDSITWSRPSKKKNQHSNNMLNNQRRKFMNQRENLFIHPPSYYAVD